MILEDRGVDKSVFIKLQENAIADVVKASDSIEQTVTLLKMHNLGLSFHLPWILQRLGAAGMGMEAEKKSSSLQNTFLYSLIAYAKNHVLRDMKHSARIPIPDSYLLVGVADEGPTYEDVENVFTLKKGQIFGELAPTHAGRMHGVSKASAKHVFKGRRTTNQSIFKVRHDIFSTTLPS